VKIGNDVFVGPHVCFTNDFYPRAHNSDWKVENTIIEDGVSIGANSVIVCGITLGKNAMIGAGSVVTKNVPAHALVYGNPAKIQGYVCYCGKKLDDIKEKCPYCGRLNEIVYKKLKR
jgi:acetyltransferase-like isoleucine patch superfamily enzyme